MLTHLNDIQHIGTARLYTLCTSTCLFTSQLHVAYMHYMCCNLIGLQDADRYVVVVQEQPAKITPTAVTCPARDNYMTLSIIMTIIVIVLGGWPSLLCSLLALVMSYNVSFDISRLIVPLHTKN